MNRKPIEALPPQKYVNAETGEELERIDSFRIRDYAIATRSLVERLAPILAKLSKHPAGAFRMEFEDPTGWIETDFQTMVEAVGNGRLARIVPIPPDPKRQYAAQILRQEADLLAEAPQVTDAGAEFAWKTAKVIRRRADAIERGDDGGEMVEESTPTVDDIPAPCAVSFETYWNGKSQPSGASVIVTYARHDSALALYWALGAIVEDDEQ